MADLPAPRAEEFTETAKLREIIRQLPVEEGEAVVLHWVKTHSPAGSNGGYRA
jgi:hypothetical protein